MLRMIFILFFLSLPFLAAFGFFGIGNENKKAEYCKCGCCTYHPGLRLWQSIILGLIFGFITSLVFGIPALTPTIGFMAFIFINMVFGEKHWYPFDGGEI